MPPKTQRSKMETIDEAIREFNMASASGNINEIDYLYKTKIGLLPSDQQMSILSDARDEAWTSGQNGVYDFLAGLIDILNQEL